MDTCTPGDACNETLGLRIVKTFFELASKETFLTVIEVKFYETVLVVKSVGCRGKLRMNRRDVKDLKLSWRWR